MTDATIGMVGCMRCSGGCPWCMGRRGKPPIGSFRAPPLAASIVLNSMPRTLFGTAAFRTSHQSSDIGQDR